MGERFELVDCVPRALGERAAKGEILAGPLPLVEFFRLEDRFERLGPFGIAVRGQARSALLFSRVPIRQLDGARIAVTEETATTVRLLQALLQRRYNLTASYERSRDPEAEALLLIGDEALRFRHTNTQYPFEIDLGFEWWLWQHLPFVFAVWAIRNDASAQEKRAIELALTKSLGMNQHQLEPIAQEYASTLDIPAPDLQMYLSSFIYRLGPMEEEAIGRFRALLDASHLL